ncbi:MAG: HlyD family efflux transporter periplasmic adaptor subunit [Planctomycetes bacterium]|nr:HlyD family efflux transporter periplasmic adaptor subunit [Planctomycetota bacterium]
MENNQQANGAQAAIRLLQALHGLTLQATLAESKQALIFHILNNTISLVKFSRAYLFDLSSSSPSVYGVSGEMTVNRQSPVNLQLLSIVNSLNNKSSAQFVTGNSTEAASLEWRELSSRYNGLCVAWLPIFSKGKLVAGLWLERWGEGVWLEDELPLLKTLTRGYGGSWEKFEPNIPIISTAIRSLKKRNTRVVIAALLALLFLVPVRLRVVAQCEVIPKDPLTVTSPIDGVIKEISVAPGGEVVPGDALFRYDPELPTKDLDIAKQQVRIIQSQLKRAEVIAIDDDRMKAEVMSLRHRLEQELINEHLAQDVCDKLVVKTPIGGIVQISNPRDWEGRSVRTGDAILRVIDTSQTMVRIYIPESDNVGFKREVPVTILLNVDSSRSFSVSISYIAGSTSFSPTGINSFVCEADWVGNDNHARVGLQGTAILYGERVTLAYWLFRRPLASVRRLLGV